MSAKEAQKQTTEDAPVQSSALVAVLRVLLVVALGYFIVKPYFDKPREDNSARQTFKVHGMTMGTSWHASVVSSPEYLVKLNNQGIVDEPKKDDSEEDFIDSCEGLLAKIIQRTLDRVDAMASTYRADSELSRFNRSDSTEWFPVSEDLAKIVSIAQEVSSQTRGAFDVTVGPLVNLYRFGPNKAPLTTLPSDEEIDALRRHVGYDKLDVRLAPEPALRKSDPALAIDLSGVAKGFAVDLVAAALEEAGLDNYLVEVGGEVRCRGRKVSVDQEETAPWVLGIQTPAILDQNAAAQTVDVYRYVTFDSAETSGVMATSGDYRNHLEIGNQRISHFIDPRTGRPSEIVPLGAEPEQSLGSVSIISNDAGTLSCAQADAWATAFSVLGADDALQLADKLGIAVLFLYRSDDAATEITEKTSPAFGNVNSTLAAETGASGDENAVEKK